MESREKGILTNFSVLKKCIVVKKSWQLLFKTSFWRNIETGLKNRSTRARPRNFNRGDCPSCVYFVGKIRYIYFNQTNKRIVCFKTHDPPPFLYFLSFHPSPPPCPRCFRASSLAPPANLMKRNFPRRRRGESLDSLVALLPSSAAKQLECRSAILLTMRIVPPRSLIGRTWCDVILRYENNAARNGGKRSLLSYYHGVEREG